VDISNLPHRDSSHEDDHSLGASRSLSEHPNLGLLGDRRVDQDREEEVAVGLAARDSR
jgi:hypothetical protein